MNARFGALLGLGAVLVGTTLWCRAASAPTLMPVIRSVEGVGSARRTPEPTVQQRLADAALAQVGVTTRYDPAYILLAYPGGDVPMDRGVCSDVVVRAFRRIGRDLQRSLHEDMTAAFAAYPTRWGLQRPDASIDHRRVLNLMTWFDRQRWSVAISPRIGDYQAGDIVAWDLGGGVTHIGIVVSDRPGHPSIVHNIGRGARCEDMLFAWTQIGHYRIR